MNKGEIIQIFEDFLNEFGRWYDFVEYVKGRGYSVEELGFGNEDEATEAYYPSENDENSDH